MSLFPAVKIQGSCGAIKTCWKEGDRVFIDEPIHAFNGDIHTRKVVNLKTWEAYYWSDFPTKDKPWEKIEIPECDYPYYEWIASKVTGGVK